MALVVYTGREQQYGIAQQTVLGTAVADNAAVEEINTKHFNLPQDVRVISEDTAHGSRVKTYANWIANTALSMPKFSVGYKFNKNDGDHFLYSFFQDVIELTTPFKKTFTPHLTQPDFTTLAAVSDVGHLLTVFKRDPVAAQSWKVKDCVSESLKLSCKQDGFLEFESGLVGRGSPATSTPSGSWTPTPVTDTPDPFYAFEQIDRFTINFGAGAVSPVLMGFDLDMKRAVEKVGTSGSTFASYALVSWDGSFDLHVLRDANVETARTNYAAGTEISIRIGWGHATAGTDDGDLDFVITGKISDVELDDGDILGAHIKGEMLASTSSAAAITVVLANGVDRGWPAA